MVSPPAALKILISQESRVHSLEDYEAAGKLGAAYPRPPISPAQPIRPRHAAMTFAAPHQLVRQLPKCSTERRAISSQVQLTAPYNWQDTIAIPALKFNGDGRYTPGRVKIRTRFVDYPGTFVLHCHILDHEDRPLRNCPQ